MANPLLTVVALSMHALSMHTSLVVTLWKSLALEHSVDYSLPANCDCHTTFGTQTEEKASYLKEY
jgi:hypothetical protein